MPQLQAVRQPAAVGLQIYCGRFILKGAYFLLSFQDALHIVDSQFDLRLLKGALQSIGFDISIWSEIQKRKKFKKAKILKLNLFDKIIAYIWA